MMTADERPALRTGAKPLVPHRGRSRRRVAWMYVGFLGTVSVFMASVASGLVMAAAPTTGRLALVSDINPGSSGSFPDPIAAFNGALYFGADDGIHGQELWKSDGTEQGTALLADINPGPAGSSPYQLTVVNSVLFFGARDAVHGTQLWRTDGTGAGTTMVTEIAPGPLGGEAFDLTYLDGTLYFVGNDRVHGRELWKSDGSAAGTTMVKDIKPGPGRSLDATLTAVGGALFFSADDGVHGFELWTSDGTEAGTVLVKDIRPGVFSNQGGRPADSDITEIVDGNGTAFFSARDGTYGGDQAQGELELWESDGTDSGTTKIHSSPDRYPGLNPRELTVVGDSVLFRGDVDGAGTPGLFRSDAIAITLVTVMSAPPTNLTASNGSVFFLLYGHELWRSDRTDSGTVLVKDVSGFIGVTGLTDLGGRLFFHSKDDVSAVLWRSDGTAERTRPIVEVEAPFEEALLGLKTEFQGTVFFVANHAVYGQELFKVRGAAVGGLAMQ